MKPASIITGFVVLAAGVTWLGWRAGRDSLGDGSPGVRHIPVSAEPAAATVTGQYTGVADAAWQPRKGRTLADILTLAEKLRFSPALETQGELLALLGGLGPDEIGPALEALKKLPPPAPSSLLGAVLTRWAATDGPAAIAWMQQNLNAKQRDDVRGGILSAWAHHDPKAAWQWYVKAWSEAPEPRYRLEQNFPLLVHAWARQDLKGALQACLSEEKHGTYDGWAGLGSLATLPEYRELLMNLITSEITDDKKRQAALRSTLLCWARADPMSAAAWLDSYAPGKGDGNLVWSVAEYWGSLDPRANADWLLKRTPPEKRDDVISYGLAYWSRAEPEAAGEWVEKAGISEAGAETMAAAWAHRDLDRAVGWAQRASAEKRADAVAGAIAGAGIRSGESGNGKTPPDISKYAEAAGVPAEDLAKRVEKLRQVWGSRL